MKKQKFSIAAIYDTETCNICVDEETNEWKAFPILFIDNDVRDVVLAEYEPDKNEFVSFYRKSNDYIEKLYTYIRWGIEQEKVPIVCAYNLMFDLQPLMYDLNASFDIKANAQSSTNVYTLDLYEQESDRILLRFWDTYHLEMGGLSAMGETCGIHKAKGDWDYDKIRTPETPLTELELYYAKRDVQVIPSYFRYLLKANEWLKPDDLGCKVLTKTSIVRQMANNEIYNLKIRDKEGKVLTVGKAFTEFCKKEMPTSYSVYALRKTCFRGGFTFTAAKTANELVENVVSVDVTSMHHTFINGRSVPDNFRVQIPVIIDKLIRDIFTLDIEDVLRNYHRPFNSAIHARVVFNNVRLKKDTCFEYYGIALSPMSKFYGKLAVEDLEANKANVAAENDVRANGWFDKCENAVFALGKLYSADKVIMHMNEVELWCFNRVYDFDSFYTICGESTISFVKPPDYVTLQSNKLFEAKSEAKFIENNYIEGQPFNYNIGHSIPEGIRESVKAGTCNAQFFHNYYVSTVKGMFNGIYGTMAQDIYRPQYKCENGELVIDEDTKINEENWDDMQPKSCKVLYNYGMRIVAGSRMHLIIAIELVYKMFGKRVNVLAGDTDSLKIAILDDSITDDDIEKCFEPLAKASDNAIKESMSRLRKNFPTMASMLKDIGHFDIENRGKHYKYHMEYWNKARVSYDGKRIHVTFAGLSRPIGKYHIEKAMEDFIKNGYSIFDVCRLCLGYNIFVQPTISNSLSRNRPQANSVFEGYVTDYNDCNCFVSAYESIALWPNGRWLGETSKAANKMSINYLRDVYNKDIVDEIRFLDLNNGVLSLSTDEYILMEVNLNEKSD